MMAGLTIQELASEVDRQNKAKRDFIMPTTSLDMEVMRDESGRLEPRLSWDMDDGSLQSARITDHCHRQIGSRLKIPAKHYDRLRENYPDLLAAEVNTFFAREPENRMVRTLDGNARAFLSDSYKIVDNAQIMASVLPVLADRPDLTLDRHSTVTDRRMYIKAVFPRTQGEIKRGDVVQAGLLISNSEIGQGGIMVEPFVYRLVCSNGMVGQNVLRQYHLGRAQGGDNDAAREIFSSETRRADDMALLLKMRDVVRAAIDQSFFNKTIQKLRDTTEQKIEGDVVKAVEVTSRDFAFNEREQQGVLDYLIRGGDLSRFGVIQAVTAAAHDDKIVTNYDRAIELERAGGQLLDMSGSAWRRIAAAN